MSCEGSRYILTIIGGGLAGLSAAYHAELFNMKYALYEKERSVGGLCRTSFLDGFLFDCSGHLLHLKTEYWKRLLKELLPEQLSVHKRVAHILSNGATVYYPFQVNLGSLPPAVIRDCLMEFVRAYYAKSASKGNGYQNFQEWIIGELGAGIGKHFMIPYNEKLWTVPLRELSCDWMQDYVPRPKIEDVFDGAFNLSSKGWGYNATFLYPKHKGIQILSDAFANRITNLFLNEEVTGIDLAARELSFGSGRKEPFNLLISTMPLNKLVNMLDLKAYKHVKAANEALKHNSVLVVNVGIRGSNLAQAHWTYLPDRQYLPYRVGVYSEFSKSMAPDGTTSYYAEVAYRKEWGFAKQKAVDTVLDDLVRMNFIRSLRDILVVDVVDVECAYVIYDQAYFGARGVIMKFLQEQGIFSIGRYGGWRYDGMEEAMEEGRAVIDCLMRREEDTNRKFGPKEIM